MKLVHVTYRQPYDGTELAPRTTSDYVRDEESITPNTVRRMFNLPSAEIATIWVRDTSEGSWTQIFPAQVRPIWQTPGEHVRVDQGPTDVCKYGKYVGPAGPRASMIQFPGGGPAVLISNYRISLRQPSSLPMERGLSNTCY